ncbi:zinc finger protein 592 isoform X1 [Danio rerio]|uniref:Zinc finger protein 592 isoform X1 n=1 Tax=Danio rerio TaxID=7955 RepID=A0A8M2B5T2_DANRE|nr:zinc finger protein 592 isoform X1 [Danio rerio]|eukprot:XP_005159353.1 zinc finger protein 592 isoform X1 [Danio rerio]
MGDMKTPDFDDLLAAFDIPDATSLDAKEAIHGNQDEGDGHLKHSEMCMDTTVSIPHPVPTADAPAVSVIVKNTSRQNSYENLVEKESPHLGHLLQNGFKSSVGSLETHPSSYPRLDSSSVNGENFNHSLEKTPVLYKPEKGPTLSESVSQFSPISSPESEDIQSNGIDDCPKSAETSYFPSDSLFTSPTVTVLDYLEKADVPDSGCNYSHCGSKGVDDLESDSSSFKDDLVGKNADSATKSDCSQDCRTNTYPTLETNSPSRPCAKAHTSRLSSCIDALAALNPKKDSGGHINSKDIPVTPKETVKISQKIPISPRSPKSPLEVVKRFTKQPDSPMSICSDSSGKASPAVATGSPPAIPRVRIKTIKTSSGEIKRTVTSILPDSETEDLMSPFGSSPSQSSVEEAFSKTLPPNHSTDIISEVIFEDGSQEASKMASSGSTKSVRSSKSPQIQNIGHALKTTEGGTQQRKATSAQIGSSANTNYLPKALHLANLNLVPHSVAASVTARSSTNRQEPSQLSSSMVCSSVPLVHQVKKVSPNTRAVVPNTAAGTLNRLLNYSNPVPTYVPNLSPPPGTNIKLPTQGYCCLECGDSFGLEKSLAYHYSRRSVHIEVACTHCSKTLVFFNRCALLAHARDHKNKGMVMQCTQLFMKPIAVDQMLVPTKTSLQSAIQIPCGNTTTEPSKGQVVLPLYPDNVIRNGSKCLECNKQISDYTALARHYQKSSEDEGLICKVCSMLLPNKCSYRAHQRIHTHKSPYCCPECGALSRSVDIQKHVKENCLHYTRKIGYSCLHCEMLFMSLSHLKSHIEEKHCEVFYKCTTCPVAFKSYDGCLMHVKNKHGGSEPNHQVIYKCSCETVFKRRQLLYQHFHNRICVFKCPECTSLFPEKLPLVQHFKTIHGGVFRGEAEKSSKTTETSLPKNLQPSLTKAGNEACVKEMENSTARKSSAEAGIKNTGWTCGVCLLWVPDRETYVSHMKTSHGKSLKRQPCRLCERSFNSPMSLKRHIRNDHNGKKKVYTCWYCTSERMSFTEHSLLKNHISLMHGVKNPDFSQMAKLESQEVGKIRSERPKKRRAEHPDGVKGNGETSHNTPSKRHKPLYRCAKCGFTSEAQAQFQEHIPQHKSDSNTPQCQHCGLCFTSQLALSRHLFIVHKVKEPEEHEDFKDGKEREISTDLSDKTVPLLRNKTGLSTAEDQLGLHNVPTDTDYNTQTSENSGLEDKKA